MQLNHIGRCINIEAEHDLFQRSMLKVVAEDFLEKYEVLIQENWDIVKSVKLEIKQEVDIKQEQKESSHADNSTNEQNSMTEDGEPENDGFQSDEVGTSIQKEPMEVDTMPQTRDNDDTIPKTDSAANETDVLTSANERKAAPDEIRLAVNELTLELKRRRIHTLFPGPLDALTIELELAVYELQLKLKRRLVLECVDEFKKKNLCIQLRKVSESVPEMEKEESVTTPAQSGRKRKPVRAPKPERKKKSVKLQNSLAISVRMEQEKVDEEIDDEIRKQRINVHELDDEDVEEIVEEIDDERINVHEHESAKTFTCGKCNYSTLHKTDLKRHRTTIHDRENAETFPCGECNYLT